MFYTKMSSYLTISRWILPNITESHWISLPLPNLTKSLRISLNLTKSHHISMNLTKCYHISLFLTESCQISPNLIKSHRIRLNLIKSHRILPYQWIFKKNIFTSTPLPLDQLQANIHCDMDGQFFRSHNHIVFWKWGCENSSDWSIAKVYIWQALAVPMSWH